MKNVALQSEGGRPYVSSSAYANYRSRINDGVAAFEGDTPWAEMRVSEVAWSSASERLPQWAAVVFARAVEVRSAVIRWGRRGDYTTSGHFEVQVWSGGKWTTAAKVDRDAPEPATEVAFGPVTGDALRVWQDVDGGPASDKASDKDRMCIVELEVYGDFVGSDSVKYREVRDAMEREWETNYAELRKDITREVLDRMDRAPKRKGGSGPFGPEEIARARRNARSTKWGRRVADEILADAGWWLDKDDAFICSMIPPENSRAISPSYERGCPIHGGGRKCMKTNTALSYRWQCAIGGEWWYNGAKVTNPATGEEVEVWDDGDGWIAPSGFASPGAIYYFQAAWRYYVLSKLFYRPYELTIESPEAYTGRTAVTQLALAYALTDDARFAHKAAVMLNRLAEVYRFYNGTVDEQRPLTRGYLLQVSWEENPTYDCAAAYDLVMDAMLEDEGLLTFFRSRGDCDYNRDGRVDFEDLRHNLQHNLFGHMYEWLHRTMPIKTGDYVVREGLVLYALGWTFGNGALTDEAVNGPYGLATNLTNNTYRDGKWWYDSPGYAIGSVTGNILRRLPPRRTSSLVEGSKLRLRKLADFALRIDCDGRVPSIGDTGGADSRTKVLDPYSTCRTEELSYLHTGDRRYLSRLLRLSGGDVDSLRDRYADAHLLFHADPMTGGPGDAGPQTALFHDSGIAILRTGATDLSRKHLVLNYGKGNAGHGHKDKLTISIIAYGYDLAADLGYPTTFTHKKVDGWEKHTMSHATVCVDGRSQGFAVGSLEYFGRTPGTQVICATGERAYPGIAGLYRRAMCLIDVSETQAYVFDVFTVKGGSQHDYVFRSLSGDSGANFGVEFEGGAQSAAQATGTLAGPDVAFGDTPGPGFIKNIVRTRHSGEWQATWRVGDAEGTGIRLSMLGAEDREIITGKGEGYGFFGKAPWDACVVARSRAGTRPTVYTAVLEPFQDHPAIRSVTAIPVSGGTGARIDVPGRRDYLLCRTDGVGLCTASVEGQPVTFDGAFARISVHEAGDTKLHLIQGNRLTYGSDEVRVDAPVSGKVVDVDMDGDGVVAEFGSSARPHEGDVIVFRNPGYICNSSYGVTRVEPVEGGRRRIGLDMSLVLSEGVVRRVDAEGGGFLTDASLTKMGSCPGLFDAKAVHVAGTETGVIEPVSSTPAVPARGPQTDVDPGVKMTYVRLGAGSGIATAKAGDRFIVCDLRKGDTFDVMRSAHARLKAR